MDELLALRLGLLAILLLFALITAITMRGGLVSSARREATQAPPSRPPRLVILAPGATGARQGASFVVAGEMSIGRDPENAIVLYDASVSGAHAVVASTARGWRISDLGSTNGTFVNGKPASSGGAPLKPGDELTLGSVVLRFER